MTNEGLRCLPPIPSLHRSIASTVGALGQIRNPRHQSPTQASSFAYITIHFVMSAVMARLVRHAGQAFTRHLRPIEQPRRKTCMGGSHHHDLLLLQH